MSEENIKNPPGSDHNSAPTLINSYPLPLVKFGQNRFINNGSAFRKVIDLYISHTLDTWSRDLNTDFTLGNCLVGVMKSTKNADPGKYGYSGYGIGFDARSWFSLHNGSWGKNIIIFVVGNGSSVHVNNKKNNISFFGEGPTQKLDYTTITAEAKYSINPTESRKRFVLSLHYKMSIYKNVSINHVKLDQQLLILTLTKKNSQIKTSQMSFSNEVFRECLLEKLSKEVFVNNDEGLERFCDINLQVLNQHASQEIKYIWGNQMPFMTKQLSKERMKTSQ